MASHVSKYLNVGQMASHVGDTWQAMCLTHGGRRPVLRGMEEHKGKEKQKEKGEKGKKERKREGEERGRKRSRRSEGWNSSGQEVNSVYSTRATL